MRPHTSDRAQVQASGAGLAASAEPNGSAATWLARFDLVAWTQLAKWTEKLELSIEDVLLLLAALQKDRPSRASDLARVSGLPLDEAYVALHELAGRGYMRPEGHRQFALTAAGHALVSSLEAAHRRRIEAYLDQLDPRTRQRLDDALGTGIDSP